MAKKETIDMEGETKTAMAYFSEDRIIADDTQETRSLYEQSRFGELKDNKIKYSLVEALFLLEKGKLTLLDTKNKKIDFEYFVKKARKHEPNFWIRYCVFRDMRSRGYIIKTALKFGADFRVYERGVKPGEDHAKWILYPVHESSVFSWHEFAAKNRVAHSTRKRLLIGIVDDEDDTTYYEISWKKP
ncbi:MAG: tRNA-intron lyase [Nanoarchaeota archaeon]